MQLRRNRFLSRRLYLAVAPILALIGVPFASNDYVLTILAFASIYALAAASWDLLAGYAGQLSFGNVAFYGVGAYSVGLLSKYFGGQASTSWLTNPFIAVGLGALAAVGLSLIVGLAAMRLRGPYLALVTFMVAIVLQELVIIYAPITGGQFGLTFGSIFRDATTKYYAALAVMLIGIVLMRLIVNSRYGLFFKAVRDDETAAQSIGINPRKYKLVAFALSALFTSLAGGFYVLAFGIVNWDVFGYNFNLLWIEMSVIGGAGTVIGAVIGAYFIQILVEVLRFSEAISLIVFAIVFIAVVRFFPRGLLGLVDRITHRKKS